VEWKIKQPNDQRKTKNVLFHDIPVGAGRKFESRNSQERGDCECDPAGPCRDDPAGDHGLPREDDPQQMEERDDGEDEAGDDDESFLIHPDFESK